MYHLTVIKAHIFKVLSSEADTSNLESDDHAQSDIPYDCKEKHFIKC